VREGGGWKYFPGLKVPRQCPVVLVKRHILRQAKALGTEEGKA
jgi:hypothetical protein